MLYPLRSIGKRVSDAFSRARFPILCAAWSVFLMLSLAMPVDAQQVHKTDSDAVMEQDRPLADSRSFMELFTKLENQCSTAIEEKDRAGLEAILAPEFTVRNAQTPQVLTARGAWISDVLTQPETKSFNRSAMAIRAFMGVAIVSFAQNDRQRISGRDRNIRSFIVDIWKVDHNQWLIAERFLFPVGGVPTGYRADSPLR
jgi:hypothetical protein